MTTNAITKAIEALEDAEGYSFGNATEREHADRRAALTSLRALVADVPEGLGEALEGADKNNGNSLTLAGASKMWKAATILAQATKTGE